MPLEASSRPDGSGGGARMAYDTPNRFITASAVDTVAPELRLALAPRPPRPLRPPPPASESPLDRCVCASTNGRPLSAFAAETDTGRKQTNDSSRSAVGIARPGRQRVPLTVEASAIIGVNLSRCGGAPAAKLILRKPPWRGEPT